LYKLVRKQVNLDNGETDFIIFHLFGLEVFA